MKWFGKRPAAPAVRRRYQQEDEVTFRRSRTLTGSAAPSVASANESRGQLKTSRVKTHDLRKHRRLLAGGLAVMVIASAVCAWLLDQYVVTPQRVVVSQHITSSVEQEPYAQVVDEYLAGRPAERFLFLLNQDRFTAYMQQRRPEVLDARLENAGGFVASSVQLTFRTPVAMWRIDDDRLYVDQYGEAFPTNYFTEPVVTVTDQSGIDPSQQPAVAPVSLLSYIGKIVAGVNDSGIGTVSEVVIPGGTLRQLDISVVGLPYRIKTHMDRGVQGQVSDIVSAVNYVNERGIAPVYVDARVEGRAFYR